MTELTDGYAERDPDEVRAELRLTRAALVVYFGLRGKGLGFGAAIDYAGSGCTCGHYEAIASLPNMVHDVVAERLDGPRAAFMIGTVRGIVDAWQRVATTDRVAVEPVLWRVVGVIYSAVGGVHRERLAVALVDGDLDFDARGRRAGAMNTVAQPAAMLRHDAAEGRRLAAAAAHAKCPATRRPGARHQCTAGP